MKTTKQIEKMLIELYARMPTTDNAANDKLMRGMFAAIANYILSSYGLKNNYFDPFRIYRSDGQAYNGGSADLKIENPEK